MDECDELLWLYRFRSDCSSYLLDTKNKKLEQFNSLIHVQKSMRNLLDKYFAESDFVLTRENRGLKARCFFTFVGESNVERLLYVNIYWWRHNENPPFRMRRDVKSVQFPYQTSIYLKALQFSPRISSRSICERVHLQIWNYEITQKIKFTFYYMYRVSTFINVKNRGQKLQIGLYNRNKLVDKMIQRKLSCTFGLFIQKWHNIFRCRAIQRWPYKKNNDFLE